MKLFAIILFLSGSVIVLAAAAPVNLQAYPFSFILYDQNNQYYGLHWNFTRETQSIYFAVNVSTTGWVGFGLSPNGQMPASDVVIGWVNGGQTYFHDRYAEGRHLPAIDPSQNWFLLNSEEENGFTILELFRNFTTCDDRDLDIESSTDRVVWSYSLTDPSDPSGSDAMVHNYKGSSSVNLIGGLPTRNTAPTNQPYFETTVSNVTIPVASTTYWCAGFRLPSELINATHYVTMISPKITPHARSFVHHMLAYLCNSPIVEEAVGSSTPCSRAHNTIGQCRGLRGVLIGGWAVGGEDFIYPEGIAYPVGGLGQERFVVLEMHYDNPQNTPDVTDSSGFRFFYTLVTPKHRAGILALGHEVTPAMIIPPNTRNYTITSICYSDCTRRHIPEEGIRIFGNFLHTHLVGRELVLEQYRWNTECNMWEELEPIDQNQNYDFNFQQFRYLPEERLVLPGDILVLKCTYSTVNRSTLTLGGEGTQEEMCLSFPVYYPKPLGFEMLSACLSYPDLSVSFSNFFTYLQRINPAVLSEIVTFDLNRAATALLSLDWRGNPQIARQLQDSLTTNPVTGKCRRENITTDVITRVSFPDVQCPYQFPNKCRSIQPRNCCSGLTTPQTSGATVAQARTSTHGNSHPITSNAQISVTFCFIIIAIY